MNFIIPVLAIVSVVAPLFTSVSGQKDSAICSLPQSATGKCEAFIPSYTYNIQTNSCVKFIYGGCGGNQNRFGSLGECERKCKKGKPTSVPKSKNQTPKLKLRTPKA